MQRIDLQEIRERTYKKRDAWWTVLLVDPLASRLVRLVAPYRGITPNLLSSIAFVFGIASAVCFGFGSRGALIAGGLLFHLSFVVDCMDGKIARLNGTGSMFGAWFDFMFDRVRVIICTVGLMGGQYARTDNVMYLWLAVAVISLDLFRYLNSSQMARIKRAMKRQLAEARGEGPSRATLVAEATTLGQDGEPDLAQDDQPEPAASQRKQLTTYVRIRNWLLARRMRTHLVSGIEYEMAVFIIGPLTFWVTGVTIVAGSLLLLFEIALIVRLYQATRRFRVNLAAARISIPAQRTGEAPAPAHDDRVPAGH